MRCFQDDPEAMEDYNILLEGYKNANTAKTILLKNNGYPLKYKRDGSPSILYSELLMATGSKKKAAMLKSAIYYNEFGVEPDITEVYPSLALKDKNYGVQTPSNINHEYLKTAVLNEAWSKLQRALTSRDARKNLGKVMKTNDPSIFKAEKPKAVENFFNNLFSKQKGGKTLTKIARISEKNPSFVIIDPSMEQLTQIGLNESKKLYDKLKAESEANYISNLHETHMPDVYDKAFEDENLIDYDIPNTSREDLNSKLKNFLTFHDEEITELNRQYRILDNKKSFAKDKDEVSSIIKGMARISSRIQKLKDEKAKILEGGENVPTITINQRIKSNILKYGLNELSDAEILLNSKYPADVLESKNIIDWYSQLGEFSEKKYHPLFAVNTKVTDEDLKKDLTTLANKAKSLKNSYNEKIKKMAWEMLQNHENFEKLSTQLDLSQNDLFDTVLPDIDILSEQILNPYFTYGKFRTTAKADPVPPLMVEYFIKQTVRREVRARGYQEDIDSQIIALDKKYRENYSWLLQEENGDYTGFMVGPFTNKWYNSLSKIESEHENKLEKSLSSSTADIYKFRTLSEIGNFLDLSNIPELVDKFETTAKGKKPEIDSSYKRNLIKKYGKHVYNRIVNNQANLIEQYLETRKLMIADMLSYHKVESIHNLPAEEKATIHQFDLQNDPYKIKEANENGVVTSTFNNVEMNTPVNSKYIVVLPKDNEELGFIDNKFDEIKENESLHDFWNTLSNSLEYVNNIMVSAGKGKIQFNSLPDMQKSIYEDILGKKIPLRDRVKMGLTVANIENYAKNDQTRINASSLKSLEPRIKRQAKWYIDQYDAISMKKNSEDAAIKFINDVVDDKYKDDALKNIKNTEKVSTLIYKSVRKSIMDTQSLDIPKMIKYFLGKASRIDSQIESIPVLNAMLELYKGIQDPNGNERKRAIMRLTSWYDRIGRGFYSQHGTGSNLKLRTSEQVKKVEILRNRLSLAKTVEETRQIQNQIESLYRSFDPKMVTSGVISFAMYTALAYALPNGIANRMYSVLIASMEDRKGERWTPGNNQKSYNFVGKKDMKFMHRLMGSLSSSEKEYVGELDKCQLFINKLGLFQDMRNEKQKASKKMGKEDFSNKMNPFYIPITKPEWQNQTQVFLNVLQDVKIKDNDGNEHPVFDGKRFTIYNNVNSDGVKKGEKYEKNGKTIISKGGKLILKPEFDNETNKTNWIDMQGDNFTTYFIKAWEANLTVNGDYSNFGGMKFKENDVGRLMSLFLTYMGMYMYRNYGAGVNLATGTFRKTSIIQGLTPTEMGTISGLSSLSSGMGAASAALSGGIMAGVNKAMMYQLKSEIGMLKQMNLVLRLGMFSTMEVAAQMATFGKAKPNLKTSKIAEKYNIPEQKVKDLYSLTRAIGIKAGLTVSILAALAALYCNDKNNPNCEVRKKVANIISNFLASLQDSVFQELSPTDLVNSIFRRGSIMRLSDRFAAALQQADDFVDNALFGYQDRTTTGEHRGRHKIIGGIEKLVVPSTLKLTGVIGTPATAGRLYNENMWQKMLLEEMKTPEQKADEIQKRKRDEEVNRLISKGWKRADASKRALREYPSATQIKSRLQRGKNTKYNWKPYYDKQIELILKNK